MLPHVLSRYASNGNHMNSNLTEFLKCIAKKKTRLRIKVSEVCWSRGEMQGVSQWLHSFTAYRAVISFSSVFIGCGYAIQKCPVTSGFSDVEHQNTSFWHFIIIDHTAPPLFFCVFKLHMLIRDHLFFC